eukprot:gnl/MRDRNA2_/MRDRNA2_226772_c0_seq1.p1 gnl/MRDRNA2_/MRDRNA2_226772_c0~~gnl/MRDRNA2_/MRDRNA2_226772_c0_seq1.p1  ORF type:complete len:762 (-),score=158.71 gnl/MRDRNA2_/MRDRNA2_226772_c0_seq1:98-2119(-)
MAAPSSVTSTKSFAFEATNQVARGEVLPSQVVGWTRISEIDQKLEEAVETLQARRRSLEELHAGLDIGMRAESEALEHQQKRRRIEPDQTSGTIFPCQLKNPECKDIAGFSYSSTLPLKPKSLGLEEEADTAEQMAPEAVEEAPEIPEVAYSELAKSQAHRSAPDAQEAMALQTGLASSSLPCSTGLSATHTHALQIAAKAEAEVAQLVNHVTYLREVVRSVSDKLGATPSHSLPHSTSKSSPQPSRIIPASTPCPCLVSLANPLSSSNPTPCFVPRANKAAAQEKEAGEGTATGGAEEEVGSVSTPRLMNAAAEEKAEAETDADARLDRDTALDAGDFSDWVQESASKPNPPPIPRFRPCSTPYSAPHSASALFSANTSAFTAHSPANHSPTPCTTSCFTACIARKHSSPNETAVAPDDKELEAKAKANLSDLQGGTLHLPCEMSTSLSATIFPETAAAEAAAAEAKPDDKAEEAAPAAEDKELEPCPRFSNLEDEKDCKESEPCPRFTNISHGHQQNHTTQSAPNVTQAAVVVEDAEIKVDTEAQTAESTTAAKDLQDLKDLLETEEPWLSPSPTKKTIRRQRTKSATLQSTARSPKEAAAAEKANVKTGAQAKRAPGGAAEPELSHHSVEKPDKPDETRSALRSSRQSQGSKQAEKTPRRNFVFRRQRPQ